MGGDGHGEASHYAGVEQEFGLFALFTVPLEKIEQETGLFSMCNVPLARRGTKSATVEEQEAHALAKAHAHEAHGDPAQTWFGLFTDLIFVAVIVQFAGQIKYYFKGFYTNGSGQFVDDQFTADCKAWKKYGGKKDGSMTHMTEKGMACVFEGGVDEFDVICMEAMLWFFAFWICWLELNCVTTRFVNLRGMMDDLLYLLYLSGVVVMAVQMNSYYHLMDNRMGFTVGLSMCTFAMACLHTLTFFQAPKSLSYSWRRICTYSFATCIFTAGMFCNYEGHCVCLVIGLLAMLWVSLTSFMVQPSVTITIEHFVERFGILVMIVTGESILALVLGNTTDTDSAEDQWQGTIEEYLMIFLAFGIMFFLKNLYFGSNAEEHYHALNEPGIPGSCLWVFLHFPLTFFLLGCGVGFKLLFTQVKKNELDKNFGAMLGLSLAGSILTMLLIRTAHKKFIWKSWVSYITRIPTLCLIPVGVYVCTDANGYCGWCLAGVLGSWFWDLIIMDDFEVDAAIKENHKKAQSERAEKRREKAGAISTESGQNFLRTCITTIPGCDNEDFAEWEATGFNGPPDEIPPWYLPYDVLTCNTEDGYTRVTKSVGRGQTQKIEEIEELGEEEEDMNKDWLGEFTDLIFVAIIIKFADQIKYMTKYKALNDTDKARIIAESMLYFYGFFVVWLEMTTEFIRFKNMPGIIDDVLRFTYLIGILVMSVQVVKDRFMIKQMRGYLAGFLVCLSVQLIVHIIYYARLSRSKRYSMWRIRLYIASIVLLLITMLIDDEITFVVMMIIVCTSIIFVSVNSFRVAFKPEVTDGGTFKANHKGVVKAEIGRSPQDDEPFVERFGLIVMITTGESILALIVGGSGVFQQQYDYYLLVQLAFVTMFYMAKLYFASNTELHEGHALVEDGVPGGVTWVICHGVLAYALLFCGVGFKLLFASMPDYDVAPKYYRGILCFSLAIAICCIIMIRVAHDKFIYHHVMLLRLPSIALIIAGAFMTDALKASWELVLWCMCWVIVLYVVDELCLEQYEVARKYTETLKGWRAREVVDWLCTMRFDPDVVRAFSDKDGPAMDAMTESDVQSALPKDKKTEAKDLWRKLQRLKKYNPHHGHGHGGHDDHGHGHGHGGHGDHGDHGHDAGGHESAAHGHEAHGHGHGDVEMHAAPQSE